MAQKTTKTLCAVYFDEFKELQQATITVGLRQSWSMLKYYRYTSKIAAKPRWLERDYWFSNKEGAEEWLSRAARLAAFVDASGLMPVRLTRAHEKIPRPDWADHITCWKDQHGNRFVLIEPMEHAQPCISRLDQNAFTWRLVPKSLTVYHEPGRVGAFSMLLSTLQNENQLAFISLCLAVAADGGCSE
jgi:hypothetical protein